MGYPAVGTGCMGMIAGIPKRQVLTLAMLVGDDALLPKTVARRRRRSVWAVYKERRRFEQQTGVILPRLHAVGRPISPSSTESQAGRIM